MSGLLNVCNLCYIWMLTYSIVSCISELLFLGICLNLPSCVTLIRELFLHGVVIVWKIIGIYVSFSAVPRYFVSRNNTYVSMLVECQMIVEYKFNGIEGSA